MASMKYTIIKDISELKIPCEDVKTLEEGKSIAKQLFEVLRGSKNGVGLAANQIGINKKVCVVNVERPLYFINPKIISSYGKVQFDNEGCLSFPKDIIKTERKNIISVAADNFNGISFFSCESNLLECVCVQHEIDHLYGITMYEREIK